MTMTIAERSRVPEASGIPESLSFKTAETMAGEVIDLDESKGIVTAIVSVTGVIDEVDDIIVPGAYTETLTKRNPKVCWAHSWEHPIGKVLDIEELMPGDKRLPKKTRDGQAWPKEAGALVARMQFNLRTDEGKNAFEVVRFYSESGECEYSIGYNVPAGKSVTTPNGTRHIKMLELYELSVVLFGAHTMTGTLDIKAAAAAARESKRIFVANTPGVDLAALAGKAGARPPVGAAQPGTGAPVKDDEDPNDKQDPPEKPEVPEKPDEDDDKGLPDHSEGVMVAVYPDAACASAVAAHIAGPDDTMPQDELHVTLAYLGKVGDPDLPDEEQIYAMVTNAVEGQPPLNGEVGGIGMFPAGDDGAPTYAPVDVPGLSLLREQIVAELGDVVYDDHGFTPHMTLGYDIGLIQPVPATPIHIDRVRVVYGNSMREITLGSPLPESKTWVVEEGAEPPTEAKAADRMLRLPDFSMHVFDGTEWKAVEIVVDESKGLATAYDPALDTKTAAQRSVDFLAAQTARVDAEIKAEGGADRNRGGAERLRHYWVHGEGATKIRWGTDGDFMRCVRLVMEHAEMDEVRAKGYCANRHKDALGVWPGQEKTMDAVVENKGDSPAPAGKSYPYLPGSYEEITGMLAEAVRAQYVDEVDEHGHPQVYIDVRASWPDKVLYSVNRFGPMDESEHYLCTYERDDEGTVVFGEREPVDLLIVPILTGEEDASDIAIGDALPLAESILSVATAFKGAQYAVTEAKAGRVLSGANERGLREALRHLIAVLAGAGIDLGDVDPENPRPVGNTGSDADVRRDVDPSVDLQTTSPTATTKDAGVDPEGKALVEVRTRSGEALTIDMDQHREILAMIDEQTADL